MIRNITRYNHKQPVSLTATIKTQLNSNEMFHLNNLLDFIFDKPSRELPCLFPRKAPLSDDINNESGPATFALKLLNEQLKSLCDHAALSGAVRRSFTPGSELSVLDDPLDFVVQPKGYNGLRSTLIQSQFLAFMQCFQLQTTYGSIPVKRHFCPAIGLYYYHLIHQCGIIRFWLTPPERFGITLLLTTRTQSELTALCVKARKLGIGTLTSQGLQTIYHTTISAREEDIYNALGCKNPYKTIEIGQ